MAQECLRVILQTSSSDPQVAPWHGGRRRLWTQCLERRKGRHYRQRKPAASAASVGSQPKRPAPPSAWAEGIGGASMVVAIGIDGGIDAGALRRGGCAGQPDRRQGRRFGRRGLYHGLFRLVPRHQIHIPCRRIRLGDSAAGLGPYPSESIRQTVVLGACVEIVQIVAKIVQHRRSGRRAVLVSLLWPAAACVMKLSSESRLSEAARAGIEFVAHFAIVARCRRQALAAAAGHWRQPRAPRAARRCRQ